MFWRYHRMPTVRARQQTHRRVLPQPAALEPVGADTARGDHETAHGLPARRAPGAQRCRGETGRGGTAAVGVPQGPSGLREPRGNPHRALRPTGPRPKAGATTKPGGTVPRFLPRLKAGISTLETTL